MQCVCVYVCASVCAGIRSLVDHARVEDANNPEVLAAEQEAARVASQAVEALRQSRAQVRPCALTP